MYKDVLIVEYKRYYQAIVVIVKNGLAAGNNAMAIYSICTFLYSYIRLKRGYMSEFQNNLAPMNIHLWWDAF